MCGPRHATIEVFSIWSAPRQYIGSLFVALISTEYRVKNLKTGDRIGELGRVLEGRHSEVIEQEMTRRLHLDLK
jgi:hypothetical protein